VRTAHDQAQKANVNRHIFVIIMALKHLCVHPMILIHTFCNLCFINFLVKDIDEEEIPKEEDSEWVKQI
jgi:hypothetical protein